MELRQIINCFSWDSVSFKSGGSFKDYLDLNYHLVPRSRSDKESNFDFEEDYKIWWYILFYKDGVLQNDALAVPGKSLVERIR